MSTKKFQQSRRIILALGILPPTLDTALISDYVANSNIRLSQSMTVETQETVQ